MTMIEFAGASFAMLILFAVCYLLVVGLIGFAKMVIIYPLRRRLGPKLKKGPNRRWPLYSVNEETGEIRVRHGPNGPDFPGEGQVAP